MVYNRLYYLPMKSWIVTSISSLILFSTITYIGKYQDYWNERESEYEKASLYIKSETCTNPRLQSFLGEFNLCDKAKQILRKPPFIAALYNVAEDLNICGHNRCTIFYMDVTKNLYKWVIGLLLFAVVGVWAGLFDLKQRWDKRTHDHYQLPTKTKEL